MKLSYRGRLFAVSVTVVVAVLAVSGVYVERQLRMTMMDRIDAELESFARASEPLLDTAKTLTIAEIDPLTDRLGAASKSRVTIIAADGRLLGDSSLDRNEVAGAQNHATRPEVEAAMSTGQGRSRRHSSTLGLDMFYVAIRYQRDEGPIVVRVAKSADEIDSAVTKARLVLAIAALGALALAIGLAAAASAYMARALRKLVDSAKAIAAGDKKKVKLDSHDELGDVAGSLNRMASEMKKTVKELARERERFEAVLEGMSDAVIALNKDFTIRLVNPAAMELLGLTESPRDRPLIEIVRAPVLHELVNNPEEKRSAEFDVPGQNRRVMARVAPLRKGRAVLVLHDVTEIRRLETVRRDFVANVSHELRTPVSVIRANAETLVDGGIDDEVHGPRLLAGVLRNAERLSNLISDLLDLSRLEAGRYNLRNESAIIEPIVRSVTDTIERWVEIDIPDDLAVVADDKALEQVLVNLIDNAVKYTPDEADIVVHARQQDDRVRIEVRDTGPGIEPALRARIFERFYRVDPGRSREMGGTGLGLSIVKHLVEGMEGTVGVEANEPKGSVFWVNLVAGTSKVARARNQGDDGEAVKPEVRS